MMLLDTAAAAAPAATDVVSTLVAPLLQFGAFGTLVYWLVVKFIPSMQADAATARADFKEALAKQQDVFQEEMRLQSEHCAGEMEKLIDHILTTRMTG